MVIYTTLRVRLVGVVEKWKDRKNFNFPHFYLVGGGKVEGWKKWVCINLPIYPFKKWFSTKTKTKQKKWQTTKKISNYPNLLKNKNHVHEEKKQNKIEHPQPRKSKEKRRRRKTEQSTSGPKKKKKKKKNTEKKSAKYWMKPMCTCTWAFSSFNNQISPISFLFILEKKLFDEYRKKTHKLHNYFSLSLSQPNTLQKIFPHFLSFFIFYFYSP